MPVTPVVSLLPPYIHCHNSHNNHNNHFSTLWSVASPQESSAKPMQQSNWSPKLSESGAEAFFFSIQELPAIAQMTQMSQLRRKIAKHFQTLSGTQILHHSVEFLCLKSCPWSVGCPASYFLFLCHQALSNSSEQPASANTKPHYKQRFEGWEGCTKAGPTHTLT